MVGPERETPRDGQGRAGQGRAACGGDGGAAAQLWKVMYPLPSRSLADLLYACTSERGPDGLYR